MARTERLLNAPQDKAVMNSWGVRYANYSVLITTHTGLLALTPCQLNIKKKKKKIAPWVLALEIKKKNPFTMTHAFNHHMSFKLETVYIEVSDQT